MIGQPRGVRLTGVDLTSVCPCREQLIVVPDISGGALCPRLPELTSSRPSSPPAVGPALPPADQGSSELKGDDDLTPRSEGGRPKISLHHSNEEDDDEEQEEEEEEEELASACCEDLNQKRLSMESGYSASEKHLEDDVVAVEMREPPHQQLPLLDQSELPSEHLSLPSSQTDGKLANRDSGIDSISSPSHSEELCFASVEDGGVAYSCSPALLPRRSSSASYAGEGGEGEEHAQEGARRRREYSEDGDSDLEEEEVELTLVLPPTKADRQDSTEVTPARPGAQMKHTHRRPGSALLMSFKLRSEGPPKGS